MWWQKLRENERVRRIAIATAIYAVTTAVYFAFAAKQTRSEHTPFNHFALLAESWLHGRLDLGGPPPSYAQNNDFSQFNDKWYVVFPPFPAVLLLPLVKLAGGAQRVQDGQFFIWLAGIAPAVSFLVFEKLRRMGLADKGVVGSAVLALLFGFGTVYFFTAEQGTVWFAAHVVGAALAALYMLFALDAERPALAGLMLGLGFMTRAPLIYAGVFFAFEAVRVARGAAPLAEAGERRRWYREIIEAFKTVDKKRLRDLVIAFAIPLAAVMLVAFWHNRARFGHSFEFGYKYLTVAWRPRMEKWGLINYHFLAKNLGVMLTGLPWISKGPHAEAAFQINVHGLALWLTTPLYLWLIWPRRWTRLHLALLLTTLAVAIPSLFYQNTGWVQFGYRFSNDYAVFLFCLLAIGGYRAGVLFWIAAIWSVLVNGFGALTFQKAQFNKYYYQDGSQTVIYQPD